MYRERYAYIDRDIQYIYIYSTNDILYSTISVISSILMRPLTRRPPETPWCQPPGISPLSGQDVMTDVIIEFSHFYLFSLSLSLSFLLCLFLSLLSFSLSPQSVSAVCLCSLSL